MTAMNLPRVAVAIVGAQKSGTTSLLRYLAQHPHLSGQATAEIGFFFDDAEWAAGWERSYARYFYGATTRMLLAKYAALYTNRKYLERLATHNPDCRLLLILRDPVDRAFSAYRMERVSSRLDRPFESILAALDDEQDWWRSVLIGFGEYARALRQIYDSFPEDQVKVLVYENFVRDPSQTCAEVFEFLGLAASFQPRTTVVHNPHREPSSPAAASFMRWLRRPTNPVKRMAQRTLPIAAYDRIGTRLLGLAGRDAHPEEMPANLRDRLAEYYRPLNLDLADMLQQDLSHWTGMGSGVPTTSRSHDKQ